MNHEDIVNRATSKGVRFIIEVIQGAHAIYGNSENYGPVALRDHTPSVAAACINCHMIKLAERMSASDEMMGLIQIRRKRGRTTFILADYTEVWLKKVDKAGKPSFRPSRQAHEFTVPPVEQSALNMEMPPQRKRMVAGYRHIGAGIEYEVVVTGPQEDGKWWEVRLSDRELPELFPVSVPEPVPGTTTETLKKRVHVRKPKKSKADGDESDVQSV